jgi:hypothetical protein
MVVTALGNLGGVKYLEEQGKRNPVAFIGLVGKVLPLQVQASAGGVNLLEQLATAAMAIKAQREAAALPAPAPLVIDAQPQRLIDGNIDGRGDGPPGNGE